MPQSSLAIPLVINRRKLLQAGASLVPMVAMGPALAQQKFVFRMAHSEAIGAPLTLALQKWCDQLNSKSGGRIDAQHFPGSQLGSYTQLIEQSRIGTIQGTVGGPDTEESVAPEIAATGGAPGFIFKDEAHVDKVLQGPLGAEVSAVARKKTGVEFVAFAEVGFRHILSKRPVTSLETLKGLKIRVPEVKLWVDFWRKLGANPTPLPYAEQYTALSTGVIDAVEADFFSIRGFKWYEQAKNLTLSYHWFLPKAVRVNAKWMDSLPPDLQALVRQTATEVFAEQRKDNRAKTDEALADLVKAGVVVHKLSPEESAKWFAASKSLFDEFSAKSPETKTMVGKVFRREMSLFTLREEDIALQQGAWAAGKRKIVYWGDQPVAGFTQGAFRNYLYPVFSPRGFAVTSESPADHPHHHSLWIGADHVNLHVPAAGAVETYIYNFYVNDVFQGRAPGVIAEVGMQHAASGDALAIHQELEWRGPREWAAPQGRLVLREQRSTEFRFIPDCQVFRIDVESAISAPTHHVSIGPTRHAWFNARVAPGMSEIHGGERLVDSQARWQDCSGPVGGGHMAGIALAPRAGVSAWSWYVTAWGVMTANPCKNGAIEVRMGAAPVKFLARYLVHDGGMAAETLDRLMASD